MALSAGKRRKWQGENSFSNPTESPEKIEDVIARDIASVTFNVRQQIITNARILYDLLGTRDKRDKPQQWTAAGEPTSEDDPLLDVVLRGIAPDGKIQAMVILNLNFTPHVCIFIGGKPARDTREALWFLLGATVEMLGKEGDNIMSPFWGQAIHTGLGFYYEPLRLHEKMLSAK